MSETLFTLQYKICFCAVARAGVSLEEVVHVDMNVFLVSTQTNYSLYLGTCVISVSSTQAALAVCGLQSF